MARTTSQTANIVHKINLIQRTSYKPESAHRKRHLYSRECSSKDIFFHSFALFCICIIGQGFSVRACRIFIAQVCRVIYTHLVLYCNILSEIYKTELFVSCNISRLSMLFTKLCLMKL